MADQSIHHTKILFIILLPITMLACSLFGGGATELTRPDKDTPTPTSAPILVGTQVPEENPCDGLTGSLEMQILVGPADAVGLEPLSIGDLPFTVEKDGTLYLIQGGGNLQYQDMLIEEWGSYTVTLDMIAKISGECTQSAGQGTLNLVVAAQGEQLVVVESEGFQGEYPWAGEHQFDLTFPLEDGAQAQGEGWVFILHLD